jgi:dihydroorotate dehydrogenase
MYDILRSLLFLLPPEDAHYLSMNLMQYATQVPQVKKMLGSRYTCNDRRLEQSYFGLRFKNPVGLGAGFDKNARYLSVLEALGFGFVEIGTITPQPQPGNDKPRLFRLPKDEALINRMGFNNYGASAIRGRMEAWRQSTGQTTMMIGGNIGKNKITSNEDAWKDYELCFRELFEVVDYFVVNVSSPNTPGLRALQDKEALRTILIRLQDVNRGMPSPKPILLKIAPDITDGQIDDIAALATDISLDGLVATNTTIQRDGLKTSSDSVSQIGAGGLSGKPLRQRSTELLKELRKRMGENIPIIASGGVFTGNDAIEKMAAGASMIQVWTGFVYRGPAIASDICRHLLKK